MESIQIKFTYGQRVKDKITGICGTVTGYCYYWGEETSAFLVERIDKNGNVIKDWFSVDRLESTSF